MCPPVDWLLMTENSVDPGHAPFLHEGVMGSDTRAGAAPMGMALGPDGVAPRGFTVSHTGYTVKSRVGGMKATRTFVAPGALRTHYVYDNGSEAIACVYFTPISPGRCATFAKFYSRAAPGGEVARDAATGTVAAKPARAPRVSLASRFLSWLLSTAAFHLLGHALSDQDVLVMSGVARKLSTAHKGWRAYWLATPADVGVAAFHRWFQDHAGGAVDWDPAVRAAAGAGVPLLLTAAAPTRAALLDHWDRHTAHCATCLKALARLDKARVVLAVVGVVAVAAAAGAAVARGATAATLPALLAAASGATWAWLGAVRVRFFKADKLTDED